MENRSKQTGKRVRSFFTSEQEVKVPSSVAKNQDLVREILTRLPLKSVARFRCVSKEWFAFLNQIRLSKPKLIYTHSVEMGLHSHEFSLLGRDAKTLSRVDSPEIIKDGSFKSIYIAGSSNGLVCLQLLEDKTQRELIIIWNPVTKHYRELPKPLCFEEEKKEKMRVPLVGFGCIKGCHGAGRDSDYKVVRISESNNSRLVTQVFTRSAKSWRVINHTNISYCTSHKSGSITLNNGVLYFLAFHPQGSWSHCSFNLHDEVSHIIPVRLSTRDGGVLLDSSSRSCVNFFAWNDSVATWRGVHGDHRYDVWVMTSNWKWNQQGTIKHPGGWYYGKPYGVWDNLSIVDKGLRGGSDKQYLCTYDLTNQKETMLIGPEAVKSSSKSRCRQVVNFVESQVSVDAKTLRNRIDHAS